MRSHLQGTDTSQNHSGKRASFTLPRCSLRSNRLLHSSSYPSLSHYKMSSLSSPTPSQCPKFYQEHQLTVQRELIQQIDNEHLPDLQEVFNTPEWLYQNEPLTRETIKRFCPKDPMEKKFVCVFCPGASFAQSTKAVEHVQQKHFKLYPFDCKKW